MRQPRSRFRSSPSGWIVSFLFFTASILVLLSPFGLGQSGSQDSLAQHSSKLSSVLRAEVAFLTANPQVDEEISVIVKVVLTFLTLTIIQSPKHTVRLWV